jgi:hypothetical protein
METVAFVLLLSILGVWSLTAAQTVLYSNWLSRRLHAPSVIYVHTQAPFGGLG